MSVTISGNGQIIKQVISVTKSDTFTMSGTTFTNITGLSASITPTNASNKILVLFEVVGSASTNFYSVALRITRNGTAIALPTSPGTSRLAGAATFRSTSSPAFTTTSALPYLDSPATTSPLTYTIQMAVESGGTGYVNRSADDSDNTANVRGISNIILMEVAYA